MKLCTLVAVDVCTLGDLIDAVGSPVLRLLTASAGSGVPVTEVLLYDAHAPLPATAAGALLLAVGVRGSEVGPLVEAAAEAGMAGVVVRGSGVPVADAEARGVVLLMVDEDAAWHHVHLMLASAIGIRAGHGAGLGDLFALADAIAAATGGATSVEDPHRRILAYSTVPGQPVDEDRRQGILGLRVPDHVDNSEQVRLMLAGHGPVRLPPLAADNLPRLACPVRAGGEVLATIWVVDAGSLAPDAEQALAQGASTAALLLLRLRVGQELSRNQSADLVRRLLDGSPDAASAAHQLGWDAVRVAAFVIGSGAGTADAERTSLRLLDLVRLQCEGRYGRHACVLLDGVVYALLPEPKTADRDRRQFLQDLANRAGASLRVPVRAALGSVVAVVASRDGVAVSRADADAVLRLLDDALPVATIDELRPKVTLLRIADVMRDREDLTAGVWRRVLAADAEYGTAYARTLTAWFEAGCDVARAARRLSIHPNTCRYRLKQVSGQFGIDLEDADERLVLWLQLRVLTADGS